MKNYDELTFTDDFLFCRILEKNANLCREIAERIIGRRIGRIVTMENQKAIRITPDGRGIRLDVYFEDDADNVYDIEMQTGHYRDLPKRIRYYQGTIDQELIGKGMPYDRLRESWIIFICTDDVFGKGYHRYGFSLREDRSPELVLDDQSHRILFCLKGKEEMLSPEQQELVKVMTGSDLTGPLGRQVGEAVEQSKHISEWRLEYMKYEFDLALARRDGREEGRQEGRQEGLRALVFSLTPFEPDLKKLTALIRSNPGYADVTEEQVEALREKTEKTGI